MKLALLNPIEVERVDSRKMRAPKHTAHKPPAMTRPTREVQSSMEVVVVTFNHMVAAMTIQRRMSHRLSSKMKHHVIQATRVLPNELKLSRLSPIDDNDRI